MSVLEFIARIVGDLAWPISIFGVALLFRKEVAQQLPRLQKLKGPGFEATFVELIREVEARASELPPLVSGSPLPEIGESSINHVEGLSEAFPGASVLERWAEVERQLRETARSNSIDDWDKQTVSALLTQLEKQEVLGDELRSLIDSLRSVRNVVAHSPAQRVSQEGVASYAEAAGRAARILAAAR